MIHLHVHSTYSVRDALCSPEKIVQRAAELGMPAIALTDHGTVAGFPRFIEAAEEFGIKPILGCEFYAIDSMDNFQDKPYHIVLLSKNRKGYGEILELIKRSNLEGFYYKPRISLDWLKKTGNLVCMTACMGGVLASDIRNSDGEHFLRMEKLNKLFGDDLYYEVQFGDHEQEGFNTQVLALAEEHKKKLVLSCDVHYLRSQDYGAHCALYATFSHSKGKDKETRKLAEHANFIMGDNDCFMREIKGATAEQEKEMIDSQQEIVDKIKTYSIKAKSPYFPLTEDDYQMIHDIVMESRRFPTDQKYTERLEHELQVIKDLDCASYFLLLYKIVRKAKEMKIQVGVGRGSVCGSLVAYALGLHDIDPVKYGLYFERFLNPVRVNLPDIDIDIEDSRRDELVEEIRSHFGMENVMPVGAYTTMKLKSAIRDVARQRDYPQESVNKLCDMVKAAGDRDNGREYIDTDGLSSKQLEIVKEAQHIAGAIRQATVHPSGFIISKEPIHTLLPVHKVKGTICCAYDMYAIELVNMSKVDLLGLRNISIIKNTMDATQTWNDMESALEEKDDAEVLKYISDGNTGGLFHIETMGATKVVELVGVEEFKDLVAILALDRPGVLSQGFLYDYINNKKSGRVSCFPVLKEILKDTWGVIIYQEQVMQIAQQVAGFTAEQADMLRYSVGKKIASKTKKLKKKFISGCIANSLSKNNAEAIYMMIEKSTSYLFNKAHATAYATTSYETAWLKYHHRLAFMTALLNSVISSPDKIARYIPECSRNQMTLLPPDINESGTYFKEVPSKAGFSRQNLLYGLGGVIGIGLTSAQKIIDGRGKVPFESLDDIKERGKINNRALLSLINSGACSSLGKTEDLLEELENIKKNRKRDPKSQGKLFGEQEKTKTSISKDEQRELQAQSLGLILSNWTLRGNEAYIRKNSVINSFEASLKKKKATFMGHITKIVVKKRGFTVYIAGLKDTCIGITRSIGDFKLGEPVKIYGDVNHDIDTLMIRGSIQRIS